MYDYYLGGKDNFAVDRAAAEAALGVAPELRDAARVGRQLIARFVEHVVRAGVRQIVDLGSGLPTQENVHQIAHRIDPGVRVVYVDHDPLVAAHGRALLAGPAGVAIVQGDLTRPEDVLADPVLRATIDFDRPVALLMMFVLHLVPDTVDPIGVVARYRSALPVGSYLAVSHASTDTHPGLMARISAIYERANAPFVPRGREEIARFFGDFAMEPPGLVHVWPFPEPPPDVDPSLATMGLSGLGRKVH